jgi:hypothetical protein
MKTADLVLSCVVIVSFAMLLTAHVVIAASLLARPPRWRALVALLLPPLAPYYALRERQRGRGATWLAAAMVYALGLFVAR